MTTTDLTRLHDFAHKKTVSVSAARVLYSNVVSTNTLQLFKLPPKALIVAAGVVVDTVANGAITVNFGFDGGTELGSALDIHTAVGYKQSTEVSTVTTLTGTVTDLTLTEGTPNTLSSGTVALTSGAGTVVHAPRILTGTGKTVTAVFSAGPTAGDFTFVVEYIEYALKSGAGLTNYVA